MKPPKREKIASAISAKDAELEKANLAKHLIENVVESVKAENSRLTERVRDLEAKLQDSRIENATMHEKVERLEKERDHWERQYTIEQEEKTELRAQLEEAKKLNEAIDESTEEAATEVLSENKWLKDQLLAKQVQSAELRAALNLAQNLENAHKKVVGKSMFDHIDEGEFVLCPKGNPIFYSCGTNEVLTFGDLKQWDKWTSTAEKKLSAGRLCCEALEHVICDIIGNARRLESENNFGVATKVRERLASAENALTLAKSTGLDEKQNKEKS